MRRLTGTAEAPRPSPNRAPARAGDGIRTRDPQLGKLANYQAFSADKKENPASCRVKRGLSGTEMSKQDCRSNAHIEHFSKVFVYGGASLRRFEGLDWIALEKIPVRLFCQLQHACQPLI